MSPRLRRSDPVHRCYRDWEAHSLDVLGEEATGWAIPHAPVLVQALIRGDEPTKFLHSYVHRRAWDGWALGSILDDLERLRRALPRRLRHLARWRTYWQEAAVAYSDKIILGLLRTACRDALSGLPDLTFLAVHLEELQASEAATGLGAIGRTHLVVLTIGLARSTATSRMLTPIVVSQVVRGTIARDLLVAHIARSRFVVVLPPITDVEATVASLRRSLGGRSDLGPLDVEVVPLPDTSKGLAELLDAWRVEVVGRGVTEPEAGG